MDSINELPNDNLENFTIQNMYNCFNPSTNDFCSWRSSFIQHNPNIYIPDLDNLMRFQNGWYGDCSK